MTLSERPWLSGIEGEDAKELIESNAPVIRVVAGPGSGKTTCLKRRAQRLIWGNNSDPKKIFVGTFTRAVTQELKEALGTEINVSTLHSLARLLLQRNRAALQGLSLRFLLEFEQDALLYDINHGGSFSSIGNIRKLREELREVQSSRSKREEYKNAAFAGAVDRWLRNHRAMLVGEVVHKCVSGLESEDIPSGMFDHVVIDEYQDLTAAEHELVRFLWSTKGSLIVLGDDDQSIYGFRFNHPNGITEFNQYWQDPKCTDLTFNENRRCGDRILHTANLMMAETGSKKSPMLPKSGRQGSQAFVQWDTIDHELCGLAQFIKSKSEESFLVLVPRRFVGYQLAEMLGDEAKTSFREEALENDIAQEAFAQACLLANPEDLATVRVWLGFHGTNHIQADRRNANAISTLPRGKNGRELLEGIVSGDIKVNGGGQLNVRKRAKWALELLGRDLGPHEAIHQSFDDSLAQFEEDFEKRGWLEKDLLELREAALQNLDNQESPHLGKVLDMLRYRIATRAPLLNNETEHRVKIMSIHSAKGLEADNVVVAGLVDQLMPGRSADEEEVAEQRRLLYVAITRAKESLIVSWSRSIRYKHLAGNGGRIDRGNITSRKSGEEKEVWVKTSKSSLLPQGIAGVMPGRMWLDLVHKGSV